MTYHNDLFPINIAYGARGGPQFNTTVHELASGYEKRNINWSKARCRYNVAFQNRNPAAMSAILDFFYARFGRAHSFPFLDHKDHKILNQQIGLGDGATTAFQIMKTYTSGGASYNRKITKIIPASITTVTVGGTPTTAYTLDVLTGLITFTSAPAASAPIVINEVQFYVHCRFETDYMDIQLNNFEAETWQDIYIVEIKE
jgi:uncharacterized protein (TIGR02217 family)